MPTSSSGRSLRWSASAASRLSWSSGSSRASVVQRSTPPAASSRETAATSCGQVNQNVVGKGLPDSSYGDCSVTAGRPKGQRAATRLKARGGRPSCRSTTARSRAVRSSTTAADPSVLLQPGVDPLDDEEPLVGPDEPEPASLASKLLAARGGRDEVLEPAVLRPQLSDLLRPRRHLVPGAEIGSGRLVVEQPEQHEPGERGPAKQRPGPFRATPTRHRVRFAVADRAPARFLSPAVRLRRTALPRSTEQPPGDRISYLARDAKHFAL